MLQLQACRNRLDGFVVAAAAVIALQDSFIRSFIFDSRSKEKDIRPYTKRMENEEFEHTEFGKSSK